MKKSKRKRVNTRGEERKPLLSMEAVEIPILTSAEVIEILNINAPRLERFQDNYPALRAGKPGKGRGSRRLFTPDDVRRIAIAKWLLDDRFQPTFVGEILEHLEHEGLIVLDESGDRLDLVLWLERNDASGKRTFELAWSKSGKVPAGTKHYYTLDFSPLMNEVDQRIAMVLENRGKEKQPKRTRRKG